MGDLGHGPLQQRTDARHASDGAPIEIVAKNNRAYLVPAAEYKALEETSHLLRSPANMRRLIASYQHALEGHHEIRELADDEQP
jgi:antitoxin YefM